MCVVCVCVCVCVCVLGAGLRVISFCKEISCHVAKHHHLNKTFMLPSLRGFMLLMLVSYFLFNITFQKLRFKGLLYEFPSLLGDVLLLEVT